MKDRATLLRALEAILFVADEPLAAAVLAQALGVERRDGGQQRDAAQVDGEAVKGGNRAANGGEDERLHRDGAVEKEPAGVKVTPAGSSYGAGDERRQRVRGMRVTRRASSVRPWAPHSPGTRSRPA